LVGNQDNEWFEAPRMYSSFHHLLHDNNDSVLLAGGSYKAISDFLLGSVSNKAATIGTSLTTIATIAGVDITAKIGSYAPSGHNHDGRYMFAGLQ